MKKKNSATFPASSNHSTVQPNEQRFSVLETILPDYETCEGAPPLRDVCMQTIELVPNWDFLSYEKLNEEQIKKFVNDNSDRDEFRDAIESGGEDFYSVHDEPSISMHYVIPKSINIRLKESPCITLDDGFQMVKIELTPTFLTKNGLVLTIDKGPNGTVKLKSGRREIYPPHQDHPSGVKISLLDNAESYMNPDCCKKENDVERKDPTTSATRRKKPKGPNSKVGLMSLYLDEFENIAIDNLIKKKKIKGALPRRPRYIDDIAREMESRIKDKIIDELYVADENDELPLVNALGVECDKNKRTSAFTPDCHQGKADKLAKSVFEHEVKDKLKNEVAVQTDVHIDPDAISEDYSFSDEPDSFLKRFVNLRGSDVIGVKEDQRMPRNHHSVDKTSPATYTNDSTKGQLESDLSNNTEPTLEGISELKEMVQPLKIIVEGNEIYLTEEEVSDIMENEVEEMQHIEMISRSTDTHDLKDHNTIIFNVSHEIMPTTSPSLSKTLQAFEEELNPLKKELVKLNLEFKNIEIAEDVRSMISAESSHSQPHSIPHGVQTHQHQPRFYPFNQYFRDPLSTSQTHRSYPPGLPCSCPHGSCLGLRRSSGIICQRIRRLPPQTPSADFYREFTTPWTQSENTLNSIWSEPEDILEPPSSRQPNRKY